MALGSGFIIGLPSIVTIDTILCLQPISAYLYMPADCVVSDNVDWRAQCLVQIAKTLDLTLGTLDIVLNLLYGCDGMVL